MRLCVKILNYLKKIPMNVGCKVISCEFFPRVKMKTGWFYVCKINNFDQLKACRFFITRLSGCDSDR